MEPIIDEMERLRYNLNLAFVFLCLSCMGCVVCFVIQTERIDKLEKRIIKMESKALRG